MNRFRSAGLTAAFLLAALAQSRAQTLTPSAVPSPVETPSPRELVDRAFQRLGSYGEPPYVVYVGAQQLEVRNAMGAQPRDFSLVERIAFRSGDEMFNISNSPNQSTELPDALIYSPPLVGPLARPVHAAASIGSRRSSPGDDLDTALKTIATVVAHGKPRYTVDIAGIERVEGHRAYHLRLQPALDPGRFSLRDLWVDTETYDLWKAHYIVTNYSPSESSLASEKDDITVYFVGAGPYWIAASWEDYSLSINGPVHVVNRNLTVTFPAKLPDWLFEKKAYAEHQRAKDPDYLTHIFDRPTPQPEESGKDSRLRITAHS